MDQINAPILIAVLGLICLLNSVPGMEKTIYAEDNFQISFLSSAFQAELTDIKACQCERELLRVTAKNIIFETLQTSVSQVTTIQVRCKIQ